MKRVLVLDAFQRSALAITRSLGSRRVPVVTADETDIAIAGCSRYSEHYVRCPSPGHSPDNFISTVADICRQYRIEIVIPLTELTTRLLLNHRDKFPGVILPFPDIATIDILADKCSLMKLAESLDIAVPRTWYADSPDSLLVELDKLPYPVVLKPGKSWLQYDGRWIHTEVRFANDTHEVTEILKTDPAFRAHPFMLQECVDGTGQGVFALYDNGCPLAFFAHRRLREKPPRGGVSVLSESTGVPQDLKTYTRKLLEHVDWHGIAMVEFKVTDEGLAYLMEINTRFWGSLQLAVDAGVDFPWLLYQLACGQSPNSVIAYKTGQRLRWILGDLDSLYLSLRDPSFPASEKARRLLAFLRPSPFRTRHEVNRWSDPWPFWCELKQYVRNLAG